MKLGHKFINKEKQYYGRGKTRVVKRIDVEYEVISEILTSLINTKFVWVQILNGKHAGKATIWPIEINMKLTVQHLKKHPEKLTRFTSTVLIWSGQWKAWWRKNGRGYTDNINQAGTFEINNAWKRTNHCGPEKKIEFQSINNDHYIFNNNQSKI